MKNKLVQQIQQKYQLFSKIEDINIYWVIIQVIVIVNEMIKKEK